MGLETENEREGDRKQWSTSEQEEWDVRGWNEKSVCKGTRRVTVPRACWSGSFYAQARLPDRQLWYGALTLTHPCADTHTHYTNTPSTSDRVYDILQATNSAVRTDVYSWQAEGKDVREYLLLSVHANIHTQAQTHTHACVKAYIYICIYIYNFISWQPGPQQQLQLTLACQIQCCACSWRAELFLY